MVKVPLYAQERTSSGLSERFPECRAACSLNPKPPTPNPKPLNPKCRVVMELAVGGEQSGQMETFVEDFRDGKCVLGKDES